MANQITDNRTLVDSAEATTNYLAQGSGASATLDTDVKIQGSGSIAEQVTSNRRQILFDAGSTQNWANNVFYFWINCGVVGLLDTKANGGFTIRFCGSNVTDWFEFYVGGSDSWPTAIEGGWVQFVVDIEGTPSNTGGTPPATSAIRYVGWSAVTATVMTKSADNTWLDEIRRLPDGSPGIIVEGRNGGTTDWDSADIATQLGSAVGTFRAGPGGTWVINTPIQFGINDTSVHGFTDTNATWLWDNQEWASTDLYKISALGNSGGTTNVTFGIKTGTGDTATGAQGLNIIAATTGVRWALDFDDPNIDAIGLYGCNLVHGGDFQIDDAAVELISSTLLDCGIGTAAGLTLGGGLLQRCSIIDANTNDDIPYIDASDPTRIKFCSFEFSDGHAIEITSSTGSPWNFDGNTFAGYGANASTDAAILIDGLTATLNVGNGGDTPTKKEINSASLTINNNVSFTLTNVVSGTQLYVEAKAGGTLSAGAVMIGPLTITTDPYNGPSQPANQPFKAAVRNKSGDPPYKDADFEDTTGSGFSRRVSQVLDT